MKYIQMKIITVFRDSKKNGKLFIYIDKRYLLLYFLV